MNKKQELIDQIIHSQKTYTDDSKLVIELRKSLEKLSVVALSQLATIVSVIG